MKFEQTEAEWPKFAKPGDFFLVPIQGYVGKLIQFGQWLNGDGFDGVQHAGIYLGEGKTIEAMPGGAIMGEMSAYNGHPQVWSSSLWDLTDEQREKIVNAAIGLQGVGYSFLDYLALAAHRFHVRVPGLKKYIATSEHLICSQLVDQVYWQGGVQLFDDGRWPGYVTPGSLYQLIVQRQRYNLEMGI